MSLTAKRCLIPGLLDELRMSQQELAECTGIAKQTISAYCTFKRKSMPLGNAIVIAEVLRCKPQELYEWDRG